eukprot:Nitzschia sp. Nitz4//scaffold142_size57810//25217//26086//NITZ4_006495-RA/size57810-processed-gene-0.47-mRNA-1//1//CDS//3329536388//7711//frame0
MASKEENGDKVTADSYGSVQITDTDKECWMLRVPPRLAEAWAQQPEGTVLGELVFRKGGKAQPGRPSVEPSFDVHVAPELATDEQDILPLHYSIKAMTKKLPTLHPFSRRPNGSVKVHGTVTRSGNLQVHQDSAYRKLSKTRLLQSAVHNSRYVKPVEANQVVQQSKKSQVGKGFGEAIHQFGKRMLEQANAPVNQVNKKAKFTADQPTRSVIFQLFSQQQYWTIKDLKIASGGRSDTEIRDVLKEIGDYHRSGDHKNTWELRKEFQNTSSAAPEAASGQAAGDDDGDN